MPSRLRLVDLRQSGLPEAIGDCASNLSDIAAFVNEAQQRLLHDPTAPDEGWWGGWGKYVFTVQGVNQMITTPRDVARIIVMDVCKRPMRIRNQFFEFLEFGVGYQPWGCGTTGSRCCQQYQAYERETTPTLATLVPGSTIRIYPKDSRDVGQIVQIGGRDSNGQVIYGTATLTQAPILGEKISLDVPFADSANYFSEISGIQKPVTFGEIQLFSVDPNTGGETYLSQMEPTETSAEYRRYFLNGLNNNCCPRDPNDPTGATRIQQVIAMGKLDFWPVYSDTDYLLIQSLPAMIEECMAIRYSRQDTPGAAALAREKHSNALRFLFGQLDHMLGKTRTAINLSLWGRDRLIPQPL